MKYKKEIYLSILHSEKPIGVISVKVPRQNNWEGFIEKTFGFTKDSYEFMISDSVEITTDQDIKISYFNSFN